ncbi:MAG: EAL domain-containing protein [Actinobacteria bacterium]|nr:EAL domain-containing protein [Actinomycetota bacterium]MCB8996715.1 EAL domain-containing protein [Actinomycetota bacterium]MCB9415096.1 EAL domain-containing protein [Actinomycetota bacterium]HRY09839.1 EAL domain-containing protein [Candidatus Nanopelagicales bacterium]
MEAAAAARAQEPAAPAIRWAHWGLLSAAMVCAVAAVAAGAINGIGHTESHLLAAAYGLLAGITITWSSTERSMRETRRRVYFLMAGLGTALLLFGQSIGYLVTAGREDVFDPRIESIPLLIATPVAGIGAILLAWPQGMVKRERLLVTIDSVVSIAALAVIWQLVLVPTWQPAVDPAVQVWVRIDQLALFLGVGIVVVLMVVSRRMGALPLPQLLLLIGGVLLWLVSDVAGELGPDRVTGVTPSIIGYVLATGLLVALGHRAAAERETEREIRWRNGLSLMFPMVSLLVAGLALIANASSQLGVTLAIVSAIAWIAMLAGIGVARLASLTGMWDAQYEGMVQSLSDSATSGWVGALLKDSAEYVLVLDADAHIVFTSPRTRADLANVEYFSDLVIDPPADDIQIILAGVTSESIPPGPHEMLLRATAGQREVEVYVRPVRDMDFQGFVVTGTDVTDARRLARSLDRTSRRDDLTGLLTAEAMEAEVAAALAQAVSMHHEVLFAVLDLSDFGAWNDSLGRSGGDEILQVVARQFEGLPPEVTAVCRIAGDSFGLLMSSTVVAPTLEQVVDQLERSFAGLILPSDLEVDLSFRVGYSVAAVGEPLDPAQLVEQADIALRRARKSRQAQVVRFRPGMNEDLVTRLAAELRVREALNNDGVVVYYQPIVSLRDGSIRSVEALARLRTGHGTIVTPDQFMDAAEYSGLVRDIDRRVRQQVAEDWASIAAVTSPDVRININVSQSELNPALADELRALDLPQRIIVEVTEASLVSNPVLARNTLETIRHLGGLVAIDDFGTGYSSLSQIVALPCDMLKIDQSFVSDMSETSTSSRLVRAIVQLAEDLGLQTVAEGVEAREQVTILLGLGCDRAQGFHYSKPLPLEQLLAWISERRVRRTPDIPAQSSR